MTRLAYHTLSSDKVHSCNNVVVVDVTIGINGGLNDDQ